MVFAESKIGRVIRGVIDFKTFYNSGITVIHVMRHQQIQWCVNVNIYSTSFDFILI